MEASHPSSPDPRESRPGSPERWLWLLCGLLLALGVAASGLRTLAYDWVNFDDDINILFNPLLGGLSPASLAGAFTDLAQMRRYLPLGYTLWDLELSLFGFSAAGFHLVSLLLSSAGAFALFAALRELGGLLGLRARALEFSALAAAALWWLHPMRAESIGWISGQLYLASSLLAFLALACQLASLRDGLALRRRMGLLGLGLVLYLCSLLVYPVHLALAPLVLLFSYWLHQRRVPSGSRTEAGRTALGLAFPWLSAAVLVGLINLVAVLRHGEAFGNLSGPETHSFGTRLLQSAASLAVLLGRTLWHDGSSPYRGEALDSGVNGLCWLLGGLLFLALAAFGLCRRGRAGSSWVLPLALVVAVLPVSGLVDAGAAPGDRYAMEPQLVLACGLVVAAASSRIWRRLIPPCAVAALVILVPLQQRALVPWTDDAQLQAALDDASARAGAGASADRFFTLCNLRASRVLFHSGRVEQAFGRLETGLRRRPGDAALVRQREEFVRLLARDPGLAAHGGRHSLHMLMHLQLARAWEAGGNPRAAAWHRERAELLGLQLSTEFFR